MGCSWANSFFWVQAETDREPDHACPHHNGHYRSGQTLRLRRCQPTRPGRIGGRRAGNVRNRFIHLGGQAFDVGLFYERFLVAGYMHPEMLHYLSYSPKRCGRFLLREQVDLKIQMGTAVSLTHHLILANQDPDGEKDCLERHDHREQTERLGVERLDERHPPAVDQDPAREPCEMRCCEHRGGGRSGERTR
jgi:hypothetical protein